MTTVQILQLAASAVMIAAAIWFMRRPVDGKRASSQGAVILLIVGLIVAVRGLGLMDYRPSPAEVEARQ